MFEFICNQTLFYVSVVLTLFLPGYFLLLAIFGKRKIFFSLEVFVVSFGLGLVCLNFLFFLYAFFEIPITRFSSLAGIALFSIACFVTHKAREFPRQKKANQISEDFSFSPGRFFLILAILFLSFFIRHEYLTETISPNATDLGHHMYWSKWMAENHRLPDYEGMPDFIIGEHIVFGVISLISGSDFFSAFPTVTLFLFNLLGVLAVFILALRIFKNKNIAVLALFFLGFFYAISSPQAKFVSGGVVGNIMGNFLMPLAFYFYYRAFSFFEKNQSAPPPADTKIFFSLAIFITLGLFYTHHLSAFIFIFIVFFFTVFFFFSFWKNFKTAFFWFAKIIFSRQTLALFALGLIFFLFILTPTYMEEKSVKTAMGSPSKETRVGLTFTNLISSIGESRLALGLTGLLMFLIFLKENRTGYILLFAWGTAIYLMSTKPHFLFVDLPSNRVGSYLSYPLSLSGAYALVSLFYLAKKSLPRFLAVGIFFGLSIFILSGGIFDSAGSFKGKSDFENMAQTFRASQYLAEKSVPSDKILKDHNYLNGDAWIKLFFMRGYKYPDSRGYFKRYEDKTKPREMCTLLMISFPESKESEKCFEETQTNFIMINPSFDSQQFKKSDFFDQVYSSPHAAIYYRNK